MNASLYKRLEEAAKKYADENYEIDYSVGTTPYMVGLDEGAHNGAEDGFLAGAEYGYKEAIEVAKEWLEKHGTLDELDLVEFDVVMNELLEVKK